jgi:hypothetical protein
MKDLLKNKFWNHRRRAKHRGIPFLFTFDEWLSIWKDSGHFHERGNKRGQYVMARYNDKGAYEIGNVKIITAGENVSEADTWLGRTHSKEARYNLKRAQQERRRRERESGMDMGAATRKQWERGRIQRVPNLQGPDGRFIPTGGRKARP